MKFAALIIGILGLVAWLEPKIGFFVGYLAFFLGYLAHRKDRDSRFAKADMILGAVVFGLSLINLFIGLLIV